MKKILVLLLLISGMAYGQGDYLRPVFKFVGLDVVYFVPGYTNISARYKWIATAVDSGLHIPQYNGVPTGTRTGVWSADGAIAADTANGYIYLYSGGGWIKFAKFSDAGANWSLTGNASTVAGTNFIGTTDAISFQIRVNNVQAGLLQVNTPFNTFYGYRAGFANTSGSINTGIGYRALEDNTNGGSNIAIGLDAMGNANGSGENVAVGYGALGNVTDGVGRNVAVGTSAMVNSVGSRENTSVGNYSMLANRQGDFNSANGTSSLRGNVDGDNNVANGSISLTQNTTAITSFTITNAGTGYADATYALNISAPIVASDPNFNSLQATGTATVVGGVVTSTTVTEPGKGYSSLSAPTVTLSLGGGSGATFTATLSSGDNNTGVGASSLVFNRTGDNNTAVGFESIATNLYGSGNTALGYRADVSGTTSVNRTAIGTRAYSSCDTCMVLGAINGINSATWNTAVGIGTTTPVKIFHTVGTVRHASLGTASGDTTTYKPLGIDVNGDVFPVTYWPGGSGATPTLQQVLDAGSTLTSSETIVGGGNVLNFTGTANQPVISVTNTNADGQAIQATAGLNGYAITTTSPGAAGLQINRDGAFNNNAPTLLELRRTYSGGNGGNGIGGTIDFYAETSGGVSRLSTQLISTFPVATDASRISHFDITGDSLTNGTIFANFQPAGIVRVNNLNDTLATKAYARSVGGGGGGITVGTTTITSGTDTRVPFNDGGVYGEDAGLTYVKATDVLTVVGNVTTPILKSTGSTLRVDAGTGGTLNFFNEGEQLGQLSAYKWAFGYQTNIMTDVSVGISTTSTTNTGLVVRGIAAQTADLQQWRQTGDVIVARVDVNGGAIFNENGADADFRIESDALTEAFRIDGSTGEPRLAFLAGSGSRAVVADAEGDISAPVSDRSVKENIRNLNVGINDIMKLKPVSFEYKQGYKNYGSGTQMGFIAQDIQKIFPNSVYTNYSNGKMGYNATDLIPVLVRAVQDQQKQIDELKELVKILIQKK